MSEEPDFWTRQGVTDTSAGLVNVTRDSSGTVIGRTLNTDNPNIPLIRQRISNGSYSIDAYGNIIRNTFSYAPLSGVTYTGTPSPYYDSVASEWVFAPSGDTTYTYGETSGDGNKLHAAGNPFSTTLEFKDSYVGTDTLITATMGSSESVVGHVQDFMLAIQSGRLKDFSSTSSMYSVGSWIRHDGTIYVCNQSFTPASGDTWDTHRSKFTAMGTVADLFGQQNAQLNATIAAIVSGSISSDNQHMWTAGFADAYAPETTVGYAVGDFCTYEGKAWICKTAIPAQTSPNTHPWDQSEWTQANLSALFSGDNTSLNAAIDAEIAARCASLDPAKSSIKDIINALKGNN